MYDVYPGKRFQAGHCPESCPTWKEYININDVGRAWNPLLGLCCSWPTARVWPGKVLDWGKRKGGDSEAGFKWLHRLAFTSVTLIPGIWKGCHRTHLGILNLFDMWEWWDKDVIFHLVQTRQLGQWHFPPSASPCPTSSSPSAKFALGSNLCNQPGNQDGTAGCKYSQQEEEGWINVVEEWQVLHSMELGRMVQELLVRQSMPCLWTGNECPGTPWVITWLIICQVWLFLHAAAQSVSWGWQHEC